MVGEGWHTAGCVAGVECEPYCPQVIEEMRREREIIIDSDGRVPGPTELACRAMTDADFSQIRAPRTPAPCFSLPPGDAERFSRDGDNA